MPHQCVRCNKFYTDGAEEILKGCTCGGRLFFYVKKDSLDKLKKETVKLSDSQKKEIEKDAFELVGADINSDEPIVLDFESIRIMKPGSYQIDLVNLFSKQPLIYKLEEGKYMIDLPETFKNIKE
ncbi:MAG: Zn-ribbon domain-containing protein [Nanoarchaeota archaeon]|nr:Zn-ribbon domain-containing protein [Nanoarchaeota archaeon]